jgi:hypothetical protein
MVASRAVRPDPPARPRGRCAARLALAAAAAALLAAPCAAQELRDLNSLALQWTRGEWASPLICEVGGDARRGLRRVVVAEASRDERVPSNRIAFVSLKLPAGARCYNDTGESQPDVVGSLVYHLDGISRPDLGTREFQEALQHAGGFRFAIGSGTLQVAERKVDFAGGAARFDLVRPGSDAWRRLQDLPSPHKLALTLEAPDGTRLALDLVLRPPR